MSSRTNRKQKRTGKKMWGMVNIGLTILYTVLVAFLLFIMFNYNFLSFRFLNIIITIGFIGSFLPLASSFRKLKNQR